MAGLLDLLGSITGMLQGFGFGTGYGAGVRFGFEDVYPFFKGSAQQVMEFFKIPNSFAQSGFKSASGITQNAGFYTPDAKYF